MGTAIRGTRAGAGTAGTAFVVAAAVVLLEGLGEVDVFVGADAASFFALVALPAALPARSAAMSSSARALEIGMACLRVWWACGG